MGDNLQIGNKQTKKQQKEERGRKLLSNSSMQTLFIYKARCVIISADLVAGYKDGYI